MKRLLIIAWLAAAAALCQVTQIPQATGGGGGGASSQAQLTDWVTTVAGGGLTLNNVSCSVSTPCVPRSNSVVLSPFTGQPYIATLTPGAANVNCGGVACSGDIFEYIDGQSGSWTFLYGNGNLAAGALVCGAGWNCVQQTTISGFPNCTGALYKWSVSGGTIASTPAVDAHGQAVNIVCLSAGTNATITGSNPLKIIGAGTWACEPGLGDGLNAIAAGTYLQSTCLNKTGQTITLTALQCFTDNNGTSTLNATNGAGTGLLTGAVTCTNAFASGTQSATTTIANGDFIKFSFVADGTSKQTTFVVTGTY